MHITHLQTVTKTTAFKPQTTPATEATNPAGVNKTHTILYI